MRINFKMINNIDEEHIKDDEIPIFNSLIIVHNKIKYFSINFKRIIQNKCILRSIL